MRRRARPYRSDESASMNNAPRQILVLIGAVLVHAMAWSAPTPDAQREITHLLGYLERSGCQFQRSGTWHDAPAARAHLEKKYQYLLQRDMVKTTDDFIEGAATSSSMGGGAYAVRCADGKALPSATWLQRELVRYRKAGPAKAKPAPG